MFIGLGGRRDKRKPSEKEIKEILEEVLGDLFSYVERYAEKKEIEYSKGIARTREQGIPVL